MSPDDLFSTPPTTPAPPQETNDRPLLIRNSRPSSIHTEYSRKEWTPDVVLEALSPNQTRIADERDEVVTDKRSPSAEMEPESRETASVMGSPCFVHSYLNKGASLAEWLRTKQPQSPSSTIANTREDTLDYLHHSRRQSTDLPASLSRHASTVGSTDDESEFGGSWTKQLADTAIGVREMSKQLGQCSKPPSKASFQSSTRSCSCQI